MGLAPPVVFVSYAPRDDQSSFHVQLEDIVFNVFGDGRLDVVRDPEGELGHGGHIDGGGVLTLELNGRARRWWILKQRCRFGGARSQGDGDIFECWHFACGAVRELVRVQTRRCGREVLLLCGRLTIAQTAAERATSSRWKARAQKSHTRRQASKTPKRRAKGLRKRLELGILRSRLLS
ncbi:uncharacterized protein BKA78DRAFT_5133 [Phyllosticta capitalensis]|uniref:uncharacterized protein n=1 Tax=Phyllosticta capitalensis TaxID=121624 RepID=UPI003131D9C8